jgi:hypothetical protein
MRFRKSVYTSAEVLLWFVVARRVTSPDWCKNCDQPQPPNVTEAIADRERYR